MQCQQDDRGGARHAHRPSGTLDEIAFLEQSQLHFAVPYFTPESEQVVGDRPDGTSISESAWLLPCISPPAWKLWWTEGFRSCSPRWTTWAEVHAEYGIQPEPEPESEPAPATGSQGARGTLKIPFESPPMSYTPFDQNSIELRPLYSDAGGHHDGIALR